MYSHSWWDKPPVCNVWLAACSVLQHGWIIKITPCSLSSEHILDHFVRTIAASSLVALSQSICFTSRSCVGSVVVPLHYRFAELNCDDWQEQSRRWNQRKKLWKRWCRRRLRSSKAVTVKLWSPNCRSEKNIGGSWINNALSILLRRTPISTLQLPFILKCYVYMIPIIWCYLWCSEKTKPK